MNELQDRIPHSKGICHCSRINDGKSETPHYGGVAYRGVRAVRIIMNRLFF